LAGNVAKVSSGEDSINKASSEEDDPLRGGGLHDDIGMEGGSDLSSVDGEKWGCKCDHGKFEEALTF
jgi:hypothetical protein